ncbi:hypothetical protein ACEPPN_000709 [Leptodophora sp. 'Broadleaf-Isolate-01']
MVFLVGTTRKYSLHSTTDRAHTFPATPERKNIPAVESHLDTHDTFDDQASLRIFENYKYISTYIEDRKIHGLFKLPPGYRLASVPRNAEVNLEFSGSTAALSFNYNVVKILVALGQAIYALTTISVSRGD